MTKKMIISEGTCNGEEKEFEAWMNVNYPEIETSIENTLDGGYYENDELVEENYWDKYCNS